MTSTHLLKLLQQDAEKKAEQYACRSAFYPKLSDQVSVKGIKFGHGLLHADIVELVEALECAEEMMKNPDNITHDELIGACDLGYAKASKALQKFYAKLERK